MSNNFPSEGKTYFGVIVDSKEDLGRILYKVWVPSLQGEDVNFADLPYVPAAIPPTLDGAATSGGALTKGQPVTFYKGSGEGANGFGTVIGLYQPVINGQRGLSGQNTSLSEKFSIPLEEQTRPIRLPPNLKKTLDDNGVEVIKATEKGDFSLSDLFGFATHGALNPIGQGSIIPKTSAIPTAKQKKSNVITGSMLSGIPGSNFDLGSIFSQIPDSAMKNVPTEAKEILSTVSSMMQTYSPGNFGNNGVEGTKMDSSEMLSFVLQELPNIKDGQSMISLIMNMMQKTGSNSTFTGNIRIGADGTVDIGVNQILEQLLSLFSGQLAGFQSSSGTLFDSVSQFGKMVSRMTPEVDGGIKDVITKIQDASPAQEGNEFVK